MKILRNRNQYPSLPGWHSHQSLFQKNRDRKTRFRKGIQLGIMILVILFGIYSLVQCFTRIADSGETTSESAGTTPLDEEIWKNDKQVAQTCVASTPIFWCKCCAQNNQRYKVRNKT